MTYTLTSVRTATRQLAVHIPFFAAVNALLSGMELAAADSVTVHEISIYVISILNLHLSTISLDPIGTDANTTQLAIFIR